MLRRKSTVNSSSPRRRHVSTAVLGADSVVVSRIPEPEYARVRVNVVTTSISLYPFASQLPTSDTVNQNSVFGRVRGATMTDAERAALEASLFSAELSMEFLCIHD